MTGLTERRRALMAQGNEGLTQVYSLPAPVTHSEKLFYYTDYPLLQKDTDWTVCEDIEITFRDSVVFFNTIVALPSSATNVSVWGKVKTDGGIFVGQNANIYRAEIQSSGVYEIITNWGWATTGRYRLTMTHKKGSNSYVLLFRKTTAAIDSATRTVLQGNSYETTSTQFAGAYFQGTLNELIIYSGIMSDSDCENYVRGGQT